MAEARPPQKTSQTLTWKLSKARAGILSSNSLIMSQGPSPTPTSTIDKGYALQFNTKFQKLGGVELWIMPFQFIIDNLNLPSFNNSFNGFLFLWAKLPTLGINTSRNLLKENKDYIFQSMLRNLAQLVLAITTDNENHHSLADNAQILPLIFNLYSYRYHGILLNWQCITFMDKTDCTLNYSAIKQWKLKSSRNGDESTWPSAIISNTWYWPPLCSTIVIAISIMGANDVGPVPETNNERTVSKCYR